MNCLWMFLGLLSFANDLSLKQIMDDPYWIGEVASDVRIHADGRALYIQVPKPIPEPSAWLKVDLPDGKVSEVARADRPQALGQVVFTTAKYRIHEIEGDLWVSAPGGEPRPLISRQETVTFVRFLDGEHLLYRVDHQLHRLHLPSGQSVQLTRFILDDEPETKDTLYVQGEQELFEYVRNLNKADEYDEQDEERRRALGPLTKPAKAYLGKGFTLGNTFLGRERGMLDGSSDLNYAAISLAPEQDGDNTSYAEFINKEGYVRAQEARPRVGHETQTWKLAVVDLATGKPAWFDPAKLPGITEDPLAEIKAAVTGKLRDYLPKPLEGPRPVMYMPGGFQPGGNQLLVTVISRDYKDRWIFLLDPKSLEPNLIDHQHDEAWLTYYNRNIGTDHFVSGAAFWRRDGKAVVWLSDVAGYQNLYDYSLASGETRPLAKGNFEVHHPFEGPGGKFWYFHANKTHPGELQFYRMPIEGGSWTALTEEPGQHLVFLGNDGNLMADLFSTPNHPNVLRFKVKNQAWRTLYDGRSEAFRSIDWMTPEVIAYPNRDGKKVYARLYRPERPNGAGVVFVHGAGYLQNAHKGWSGYFHEYMFHNLLVREGYTVLDPDYQASAGYGRDWRCAIYRHMGGKDLNDVLDGAAYLVSELGLDSNRLGVYGGSYGGFITLMAMFDAPDTFQAGAALRPVTDWAYYNHWYTSRILNTPREDPEAYARSSPINFAQGLKGQLLICHGMVDDNVHYQDSVRLAQRLIELGKEGWTLSGYPVEPHGFKTPSSWYDEYRRIHELFQDTIGSP